MSGVWFALGLTLFAGMATGIGSAIAFTAKRTNYRFLSVATGFSAGVMLYVSFVEIFFKGAAALTERYGDVTGLLGQHARLLRRHGDHLRDRHAHPGGREPARDPLRGRDGAAARPVGAGARRLRDARGRGSGPRAPRPHRGTTTSSCAWGCSPRSRSASTTSPRASRPSSRRWRTRARHRHRHRHRAAQHPRGHQRVGADLLRHRRPQEGVHRTPCSAASPSRWAPRSPTSCSSSCSAARAPTSPRSSWASCSPAWPASWCTSAWTSCSPPAGPTARGTTACTGWSRGCW